MDNQMATVKSIIGNNATVELGSGEIKTARIPIGVNIESTSRVLITQASGKYLIINTY